VIYTRIVFTDDEGWQIQCWKLAQSQHKFIVIGRQRADGVFVDALCDAYDYDVFKEGMSLGFLPRGGYVAG